ncbi:plasma-membrane choline transporter-domain-containing protein [Blastocladiella britannica]|nr:plasma-membrane choline transporter-domain-containing protein [Blastocladiella britannica]
MGKDTSSGSPTSAVQKSGNVDPGSPTAPKGPAYADPPGVKPQGRSCHDIFFMILFVICWAGMVVVAILAFKKGDVNRLRYGSDSWGNLCGVPNVATYKSDGSVAVPAFDATSLRYKHFLNLGFSGAASPMSVCVAACPSANAWVCQYGIPVPTTAADQATRFQAQQCWPAISGTKNFVNRCVPVDLASVAASALTPSNTKASELETLILQDLNAAGTATTISQAVADSWREILGMGTASVAISFIWLILLNWFVGFMVWLTVIFANLAMGGLTGFCFYNWNMLRTQGKLLLTSSATVNSQVQNQTTMLVLGIIFGVIFLVIFLISTAGRNRIKLAVALIKETSKAVRAMPLIVLFPIFKYVAMAGLFAFFTAVFAMLATSGDAIAAAASSELQAQIAAANAAAVAHGASSSVQSVLVGSSNTIREIQPDKLLPYLQIYMVFGFFWSWAFVLGVWQTTIAGAIASWYWCRDKTQLPARPIASALYRCFRYHLGSIAFGSLIIAIVQTVRVIILEAQRRAKATNNKVAQYILSCLQCCFWCLEKFLKMINKNAFIEVAVYGYSFCEAARTAFQLLWRNAFRVVVVDGVSNFVLFLGKLFIVAVTCIISLALLTSKYSDAGDNYGIPLVFIFVISWVVASFFTAIVDMGIDTLFLCFCEDCERNDGSANSPYYMSPELKAFTDKHKGQQPDMAT